MDEPEVDEDVARLMKDHLVDDKPKSKPKPVQKPKKKNVMSVQSWSKSSFAKMIVGLGVLIGILAGVATIFPEARPSIAGKAYSAVGLADEPIQIEALFIDEMSAEYGYHGCPSGFFIPIPLERAKHQPLVMLKPWHQVILKIKKNDFVNTALAIRKVGISISAMNPLKDYAFVTDSDGCGAGLTEKIYDIDLSDLNKIKEEVNADIELQAARLVLHPKYVEANISDSNEEKFDYIALTNDEPEDYIRMYIPIPTDTLMMFRVQFDYEISGKAGTFLTDDLYVGNTESANRWLEGQKGDRVIHFK